MDNVENGVLIGELDLSHHRNRGGARRMDGCQPTGEINIRGVLLMSDWSDWQHRAALCNWVVVSNTPHQVLLATAAKTTPLYSACASVGATKLPAAPIVVTPSIQPSTNSGTASAGFRCAAVNAIELSATCKDIETRFDSMFKPCCLLQHHGGRDSRWCHVVSELPSSLIACRL